MTRPEVSLSDLQLRGKAVADQLRRTPGQSQLVSHRDADDLVLTTAERAEQEHIVATAATRMFAALMRRGAAARQLVTGVLPDAFPWVEFLPHDDVQAFVVELGTALGASAAIENPAPVVAVIETWRHTAMVFADPELAALLAGPTDSDFGAVPELPKQ